MYSIGLDLVEEKGWRSGFINMLRKENSMWWKTRRWWVQSIIWLLLTNGLLAIALWILPKAAPDSALDLSGGITFFMQLLGAFPVFGVIVLSQGAIIEEKKTGTAEWILSNPVSRTAFVLSKLVAYALGLVIIIVLLQGAVAYLQLSLYAHGLFSPMFFVVALGMNFLHYLFYLAMSLMLGTFFRSRGGVIGIPLAFTMGYELLVILLRNVIGEWSVAFLPGRLPAIATMLAGGEVLVNGWTLTLLSTSILTVIFVGIAILRFTREEF